jgi:D-amino peptidase
MSEAGINAAIAADIGVPVVLITGDDSIVAESKQRFGPIEGVAVKRAIGFHSAATMTPEAGQNAIRQRAKVALERRADMRPYKIARPLSHTVRYAARDMADVSKFITFVTSYDPTLTP